MFQPQLRVLLASNDALMTRRLMRALSEDERFAAVGAAASIGELEVLESELGPHIVVLDHRILPPSPSLINASVILLMEEGVQLDRVAAASPRVIAFARRDRPPPELVGALFEAVAIALPEEVAVTAAAGV